MPPVTFGRVMALLAIVTMVGLGFCLVDADHATNGNLCLLFLVATLGALLVFTPILTGPLTPARVKVYHRHPSDLPAPPPKA